MGRSAVAMVKRGPVGTDVGWFSLFPMEKLTSSDHVGLEVYMYRHELTRFESQETICKRGKQLLLDRLRDNVVSKSIYEASKIGKPNGKCAT